MHLPRSRLYWRLFGQVRIDGWNANWAVIDAKNIPDKSRYGKGLACRDMADAARVIVIEGTREDWPGGPRTLTPLDPDLEPNRRTYWFGAALAPAGPQVWFRITGEVVRQMPETTPGARGHRLVDVHLAWLSDHPDHQWEDLNRFQVSVSNAGDTRIKPYGD